MQLKDPMGLLEYQALGLEAINFCDNYTTYWNEFHKEGERMVDAVVMPVAPLTGIRSGQFFHLGARLLFLSNSVGFLTRGEQ